MNPAKIYFITIILDNINHLSLLISVDSVRHIHLKYIHKNANRLHTRIYGARQWTIEILEIYLETYFFIQVAMESFCHVRYGNADCRKLDNYFVIIIKAELFYD